MNLLQRIIIAIGLLVILVMGLFPPWTYVYDGAIEIDSGAISIHTERPARYTWITRPPHPITNQELRRLANKQYKLVEKQRLEQLRKTKGKSDFYGPQRISDRLKRNPDLRYGLKLDIERLVVQFVGVCIIIGGLLLIFQRREGF